MQTMQMLCKWQEKKSVQFQYRQNHLRLEYVVYVSNNITFFPECFDLWLVESAYAELRG